MNAYLKRAQEIIGDRTQGEIDYDDAIVANLNRGMDIKNALRSANEQYPDEALEPKNYHWDDLAARYEYIAEHKKILKKLGLKE